MGRSIYFHRKIPEQPFSDVKTRYTKPYIDYVYWVMATLYYERCINSAVWPDIGDQLQKGKGKKLQNNKISFMMLIILLRAHNINFT